MWVLISLDVLLESTKGDFLFYFQFYEYLILMTSILLLVKVFD